MIRFLKSMALALCLLIAFNMQADNLNLDSLQTARQEFYFSLEIQSPKQLAALSAMVSIDQATDSEVIAYANPGQYLRLLEAGYQPKLLPPPGVLDEEPAMLQAGDFRLGGNWDYYPTYEAYIDMMYAFQSSYPNLCTIHNIGTLNSGRQLLVAQINNGTTESKPEFLYTGTIHGDETTGYILLLRMIEYLLMNYGSDPEITSLVNNLDIWINPLANPDGTYWGGNHTVNGSRRGNANNVDLNRNYPDPEDGPHPDGNPWQPETVFFMEFAEARNFVMSANTHGGIEVINYPFDTWSRRAADDDWWILVSREYADTAQFRSPSGYMTALDNGITNGYDWYSISGGRQDYMNFFHYCREVTMELSDSKTLPASQLPALWNYNYRSLMNYMQQSTFGIHGTITDTITNEAMVAKVEILGHDFDNSYIYSSLPAGNYHRLIKEGTYDLTFTAEGYHSKTISNVSIADYEKIVLDVQLVPGTIIADFTASAYEIAKGGQINFYDGSYGQNIVSWDWTFEGAVPATSTLQNPTNITYPESGLYDVSLTITNSTGETHTINKNDLISVTSMYIMQNGTFTTCEGSFYDPGGPNSNYSNNQDIITTFIPDTEEALTKVEFTMFDIEANSSCSYDWLKIYDGPNTLSPLLGTWCGTNSPGTIIANNSSKALTFHFHSDGSVTNSGWAATISCFSTVDIQENHASALRVYPNPNQIGILFIDAAQQIESLRLRDINGKLLNAQTKVEKKNTSLNVEELAKGTYFLELIFQNTSETRKILID